MYRPRLPAAVLALSLMGGQPLHAGLPAGDRADAPGATARQTATVGATMTRRNDVPASEARAKAALDASPRHSEWMNVLSGGTSIRTFIVHPVRRGRGPVAIVISDNRGMNDWIRSVGDQLAAEGFTAMVPDLWSGLGPAGGDSESFASADERTRAIGRLSREETVRRLQAVWEYAIRLPAINERIAVVGFGWGADRALEYAEEQPMVAAAVTFDGMSPSRTVLAKTSTPVLALFGDLDAQAWPKAMAFLRQHTN
ncbi:MAG: dienelactone hydrolase family protein [Vicinamibacterales bacterium]